MLGMDISGMDISEQNNLKQISNKLKSMEGNIINATSIYEGRFDNNKSIKKIFSISSESQIGTVVFDETQILKTDLENNTNNSWAKFDINKRLKILNEIANNIEENPYELIFYLTNYTILLSVIHLHN